jgi:hypothetical protein
MPPSSALKIQAVCYFQILASVYKFTLRYNPKYLYRHLHLRENLESHTL